MISSLTKLFCLVILCTATQVVHAEMITKFDADYTIVPDATVKVVENITYDFSGNERHGIYRTINNKHPQQATAWYKSLSIELSDVTVTRDGKEEPFSIDRSGRSVTIKIGDADEYITNEHLYTITYTLTGALSYGESGAEFYYNVTGNDWEVPIVLAVATVYGDLISGKYYCYQGEAGSTDVCTNSMRDNGNVIFTANSLEPGGGLTIATELDATKVANVVLEEVSWLLFGSVLGLLWAIALGIFTYRFRYQKYDKKTVVAQHEPYKNFLPMYTGFLFDNLLDPRDISAGILYLAEQGFIKITKTTKKVLLIIPTTDYSLTLLRPLTEIPSKFLVKVSELLFVGDTTVGTKVELSNLAKERAKNAERIMHLKTELSADLKENGFLQSTFSLLSPLIPRTLLAFFVLFGGFLFVPNGLILVSIMFVITLVSGLILLIPRKTEAWFEARNHTEGFKLFLTVTDKERFDFHNAPEKSPELFMQYLPYAVALGVEEKWAKVFSDITIPQPDWYEGGNIAAFSAGSLTSDIGAFSTALSSNSGVSGSSGGGSSGGGGGGGGGGSW
jgi:uncharacterized membrane protein